MQNFVLFISSRENRTEQKIKERKGDRVAFLKTERNEMATTKKKKKNRKNALDIGTISSRPTYRFLQHICENVVWIHSCISDICV